MILNFYEIRHLKESIKLLKEYHLEKYKQYFTLFNDDKASPIFNTNNDKVGTIFLFDYNIKDYSAYMLNDELKVLILLYFNYIRINLKNNKERNGKYILINPDLINAYKNYYNYSELEKRLNKTKIAQEIINNIKNGFNDFHDVLNDKKISILIKLSFLDINNYYKGKKSFLNTNIKEEPIIESIQGKSYLYFKNFELIEPTIYELLINKKVIQSNLYLRECTFENNYVYFDVPEDLCNTKNIEISILNKDTNSFSGNFLIHSTDGTNVLMKILKISGQIGLYKFFDSCQNNEYIEELFDNTGKKIGIIYNLMNKEKKQNINNNIVINNNNLINGNDNNFNVNNFNSGDQSLILDDSFFRDNPFFSKKLKDEFQIPPLIGLKNVGAYCYMNATLQCLSQIEKLTNYFKYNNKINYIIEKKEINRFIIFL